MLSGITSLFTPRSKPSQAPPPPASDASRNAIPLSGAAQPLVTPVQQEDGNTDAEEEEQEDLEDSPQPKLIDAKNYESPTIAKARRLSDGHGRDDPIPTVQHGTLPYEEPNKTRAPTRELESSRNSQSLSSSRPPVEPLAVPGKLAAPANSRKRKHQSAEKPATKKKRQESPAGSTQGVATTDHEPPLYEASMTVDDLHHYSAHVFASTSNITPWKQLPRIRSLTQGGHTYHERDAVQIEVGDSDGAQEATGLILELRGNFALVAWYYTPEDAKAQKRPTTWAKGYKTHIISSHVDVLSVETFYNSPLSAKQRAFLVEDKVLNLSEPKGRTPRLTGDAQACMLARALR